MKPKRIHLSVTRSGQNADYHEVQDVAGQRLQVRVHTDTVPRQAYARVERWDGSKWQLVFTLAPEVMATDMHLAYQPYVPQANHFQTDVTRLLQAAEAIIGEAS